MALIQYTKKVENIPEVDHVKRVRVWAGVNEHQLPPRHKYRGSDKHVRSAATKASSVCVALSSIILKLQIWFIVIRVP